MRALDDGDDYNRRDEDARRRRDDLNHQAALAARAAQGDREAQRELLQLQQQFAREQSTQNLTSQRELSAQQLASQRELAQLGASGQRELLELRSRLEREASAGDLDAKRALMQLESQLRTSESQQRQSAFERLFGEAQSTTTPRVEYGGIGANEEAARGAAFARAKEQAGQTARASLSALEDVSAERGLMGSTLEASEQGRVAGGARADIQDFTREQLMQDLDRSREVANMTYQGGITQRGQDLSRQQALLGLLAGRGLY